ncbi:hypothetical protein DVH24_009364 [Malus domestica]|uniref:Transmembrane protein n=1 Tax=Malus domestica TaxID=3750 RepID=A0A498IVX1_MALDO|nr:hypothetical protein DVH24_009364 [Malus domestica]
MSISTSYISIVKSSHLLFMVVVVVVLLSLLLLLLLLLLSYKMWRDAILVLIIHGWLFNDAFSHSLLISPMMKSHFVKQCFTLSRHLLCHADHRHLPAPSSSSSSSSIVVIIIIIIISGDDPVVFVNGDWLSVITVYEVLVVV